MTGSQYADLIARYVLHNYGARGIKVYREVSLGKTIIGKDRRIDVLLIHEATARGFAVECKYQDSQGTVDEKIPYALQDMEALRTTGCVTYAGEGFSKGILHVLEASHLAAYCLPDANALARSSTTWEFDHMLVMNFGWWDIVVEGRKPFVG